MNQLELPRQLAGNWEHGLILTYGADLPFFENALWSQLHRCRNKIILADARQYLAACQAYATRSLLRHANHRYVVAGIVTAHAAHAKAILLVNAEAGRLWVGSGNLGWQGYASGGELFTQYDYTPAAPAHLPAFQVVWALVREMQARRYLNPVAVRHLELLATQTPWLAWQRPTTSGLVRHNLHTSFLKQLLEAVGSAPVEELWLLAPFLDREAQALQLFLKTFRPKQAMLLIQPNMTSADANALARVQQAYPQLRFCTFEAPHPKAYVHAKLYIIKTAKRAFCLQGSPNLSLAALHYPDPQGNIELANLAEGPPTAFDAVLAKLKISHPIKHNWQQFLIQPVAPLPAPAEATTVWQLLWGELVAAQLTLGFQGEAPALANVHLVIGEMPFEKLHPQLSAPEHITFNLPQVALEQLAQPVAVRLRWGALPNQQTNPIFVCHRAALENALHIPLETDTLRQLGYLEIDDEEIEQLLAELEATLLIDGRSIWVLAGKAPPPLAETEEEETVIPYADINYALLRHHPKVLQYLQHSEGRTTFEPTRLQILLNAISEHFNRLVTPSPAVVPNSALVTKPAEDEVEAEATAQETADRSAKRHHRLRRLFQNFIGRYLRGFRQPKFQQLVGFEVMANNYIIFDHLLGRIFEKDWASPKFLVEARLDLWAAFWGGPDQPGYVAQLTQEELARLQQWLTTYHGDAELLAGIFKLAHWCNTLGRYGEDSLPTIEVNALQLRLRNFWRQSLSEKTFTPTLALIQSLWLLANRMFTGVSPTPEKIIAQLAGLARWETRETLLASLCLQYGLRQSQLAFAWANVHRTQGVGTTKVQCLVLAEAHLLQDFETAVAVLQQWMQAESQLGYYRIVYPNASHTERLIFYDAHARTGTFLRRDRDKPYTRDFNNLVLEVITWDATLKTWANLAAKFEAAPN